MSRHLLFIAVIGCGLLPGLACRQRRESPPSTAGPVAAAPGAVAADAAPPAPPAPDGPAQAPDTAAAPAGGDGSRPAPLWRAREPSAHRAAPVACNPERPPGNADPSVGGGCRGDADCTAGRNGRCTAVDEPHPAHGRSNQCTYDACLGDADCGPGGVCACRTDPQPGHEYPWGLQGHACVKGDCVVDGDCPSGYCSPSTNDDCNAPRLVGFFCRTADDECVEDGDCTGPSGPGRCVFRAQRGRWACWYATTEICGIS